MQNVHNTVRVFKIDAAIWNAFPKCVCGATPPQTGRLLPKIRGLLPRIGRLPNIAGFNYLYTLKFPKQLYRSTTHMEMPSLLRPCNNLATRVVISWHNVIEVWCEDSTDCLLLEDLVKHFNAKCIRIVGDGLHSSGNWGHEWPLYSIVLHYTILLHIDILWQL